MRAGGRFSLCGLAVDGRRACVNVVNGRVRDWTPQPRYEAAASGNVLILPAVIDLHVHLRGAKLGYKETAATGTAAAARGGVAVVADMPNTVPEVRNVKVLRERLAELSEQAHVDYVVYAGVPEAREEVRRLASEPVAGFKLYPEDLGSPLLCDVMRRAWAHGKLVIVHPELPEELAVGGERDWDAARPCYAELAAVEYVASLVERCGVAPRIHVTHASCPSTVEAAARHGFTVDVTPHHLLAPLYGLGPRLGLEECVLRVNPPLRGVAEAPAMLKLALEARVDAIASDHAPHTLREKSGPYCLPGIASLEHWPVVLLTLLARARAVELFPALTAGGPSRVLGLKLRGCLEPGCWADVLLVGMERDRLEPQRYSKAWFTPYLLAEVDFRIEMLVVRGVTVYTGDDGLVVEPGFGVNALEAS